MRVLLLMAGLAALACGSAGEERRSAAGTAPAAEDLSPSPRVTDGQSPSSSVTAAAQIPKGLRGELLFQSDREGPTRLFVLDLATVATRRVGATGDWFDEEPRWSPDGRQIAFGSTRGQKGNIDIFVMNADGTNIVRLTDHPSNEQGPVWAADGKSVFFTGERDGRGEIYRVWLVDKRVERITAGIDRSIMPATSPDGRYLAYAAQTIMSFQIHLIDLTNGNRRQVTSGGGACRPSFSPDSQELAFVRLDKEPSRLEAVKETGRRVLFEDTKLWGYYPDYSPDGRYLAFSVSPEHHQGEDWDLALMDLQKPGQFVRVTSGPGNDRVPDWKPR
jgi:Tol biopolymer transport system component